MKNGPLHWNFALDRARKSPRKREPLPAVLRRSVVPLPQLLGRPSEEPAPQLARRAAVWRGQETGHRTVPGALQDQQSVWVLKKKKEKKKGGGGGAGGKGGGGGEEKKRKRRKPPTQNKNKKQPSYNNNSNNNNSNSNNNSNIYQIWNMDDC